MNEFTWISYLRVPLFHTRYLTRTLPWLEMSAEVRRRPNLRLSLPVLRPDPPLAIRERWQNSYTKVSVEIRAAASYE